MARITEADKEIIEARVIQKVDTEANWLANPLPLYQGEIALVRSGDRVVNMKVGNGTSKFSELNYVYNGGFNGSINTSTVTTDLQNGFYFAEVSGTYNNAGGVVVKEGYFTILEKYSGGWKKSTEVKMPMQDLTALENKNGGEVEFGNIKNVEGGKVFDYVNNKSITKFNPTAYVGGYPKDALVFYNDNVWMSMVPLNTETPQKGTSKWKEVKMSSDVDQEFTNTLKKDEENVVTSNFSIINEDGQSIKLLDDSQVEFTNPYGKVYIGFDDIDGIYFKSFSGGYFSGGIHGIYGEDTYGWSLKCPDSGDSQMLMPMTYINAKVLTTGVKVGTTTYYADDYGVIELPEYSADTLIDILTNATPEQITQIKNLLNNLT